MDLQTHSAPSPQPSTGPRSKPEPTTPPTQTFKDAGMVRVIETLGFESDDVDCPHCQQRGRSRVEERPSQSTTTAQIVCCLLAIPFCCLTWFIPKWSKWYFDVYHKCPHCGCEVAFVKHNQERITARYVRSQYGVKV